MVDPSSLLGSRDGTGLDEEWLVRPPYPFRNSVQDIVRRLSSSLFGRRLQPSKLVNTLPMVD